MSGLCGWAGHTADEESRRKLLARMAEALSRHDGSDVETRCSVGCAVAAASLRGSASALAEGALLVAIAGRPVWNDRGLADLAATRGEAHALAEAYATRGVRLLDILGGTFALAVVREGDWEALLAVDRFATIPLDYAYRHGCLVFGTHGQALQAHPRAESEIDPQSLYSYFFHGAIAAPGTIRKNHRRLLPGHRLLFREGRVEVEAYFRTEPGAESRPLAELTEEYRALLRASVEHAAGGARAGVLLDGPGSLALTPTLAQILGGPVAAYAATFDGAGASDQGTACPVTPEDVLDAAPRLAEAHSDPFAVEFAVPAYCCARLAAKEGVDRMLSGAGLFAHDPRYEAQLAVERFGRLPRLLRAPLALLLRGDAWAGAKVPLPSRLHAGSMVLRLGAKSIFTPEFLRTVDTEAPLRLVRHVWASANVAGPLDRMLGHDAKFDLADRRLPQLSRACELAQVEVAHPLLSDDLVALAAHIPASSRAAFFRRVLPAKGPFAELPLGPWLRTHRGLQQLSGDTLTGIKARGIVRPAFVDEVVQLHRTGKAAYHGAMVWTLILLEQWFRIHERKPVQAR